MQWKQRDYINELQSIMFGPIAKIEIASANLYADARTPERASGDRWAYRNNPVCSRTRCLAKLGKFPFMATIASDYQMVG